jgi:hypothetical protein
MSGPNAEGPLSDARYDITDGPVRSSEAASGLQIESCNVVLSSGEEPEYLTTIVLILSWKTYCKGMVCDVQRGNSSRPDFTSLHYYLAVPEAREVRLDAWVDVSV